MALSPGGMAEWADQEVIRFLNMKPNAGTERVEKFVEACHRFGQLMEQFKSSSVPKDQLSAEAIRALVDVNSCLSEYRWHPYVFGYMQGDTHFLVQHLITSKTRDPVLDLEHYAIQWIVDQIDAVSRIRRCRSAVCRKWFFAKTDHQKYCGGNCRQQDASQGELFKRKRRVYMKKYRKEEAERDAKAKRQAKGKSK
jgi:hypothetical protein